MQKLMVWIKVILVLIYLPVKYISVLLVISMIDDIVRGGERGVTYFQALAGVVLAIIIVSIIEWMISKRLHWTYKSFYQKNNI